MANFDYMRTVRPMVAKLAAAADTQVRSTPPGVSFAGDVLEDAELVFETAIGQHGRGLSAAEKQVVEELLQSVEAGASEIGPSDAFWTDVALRSDSRWEAIRLAAQHALRRLDELRGHANPPQ